jgi:dihydropyrimidinase
MLQLLIKNGTCVIASGSFEADVAVAGGQVVALGRDLDLPTHETLDARGKLILPGVIDAHVHLPWPSASLDSVDDFASGTAAAVCGGVTTIIEYVVTDESGRLVPTLDDRLEAAAGNAYSDYSFHLILRKVTEQTPHEMAVVVEQGFPSFKIYTAYEGFHLSDGDILRAMGKAKELDALICVHAEDGAVVSFATDQLAAVGKTGIEYYPDAHPLAADLAGTGRIIEYARYTGARVHIAHVNTAAGARMISEARRSGLEITGETCPHYLMFHDDVYRTGQPEAHHYVLAPAIRTETDRLGLWDALAAGDLDCVATDHCPYTSTQKLQGQGDFRRVPGGAGGVETSLPLLYTYGLGEGRISLERLVQLASTNPAKLFGLFPRKGTIAVGSDADLVVYDPEGRSTIESSQLHSRTDHSLYDGIAVAGRVERTILRGVTVAQEGELVPAAPAGQVLRRRPKL